MLIDEMRVILLGLGVEWTEHDLPGETGEEIGFMFPRAKWEAFPDDKKLISDALNAQVNAWLGRASVNPLPDNVFLREDCRIDVVGNIKNFLAAPDISPGGFGREWDEQWMQFKNIRTGETADVYANRKTQKYTISKDISGWIEVDCVWRSDRGPRES